MLNMRRRRSSFSQCSTTAGIRECYYHHGGTHSYYWRSNDVAQAQFLFHDPKRRQDTRHLPGFLRSITMMMCLPLTLVVSFTLTSTVVAQESTSNIPSTSVSPSISHSPAFAHLSSTSGGPSIAVAAVSSSGPTQTPKPSDRNFCGTSLAEAGENCSADRHCPMGNNDECPPGLYCYTFTACNIVGMPTMQPTISPKPTLNPASTLTPTMGPIAKDDIRNFFFCGTSWGDASERCYRRCLSGLHTECPSGEECFSNAGCQELKEEEVVELEDSSTNSTLSPDASPSPTLFQNVTYEPTAAPIEKDDIRNFFFCGKDWSDASDRCYLRCLSGFHSECPEGEECFAQADCRGVKEIKTLMPTQNPSMAPFSGTRAPTLSPMPTIPPSISLRPLVQVTISPEFVPSDPPTTHFPTDIPTLATCGGDPCPDPDQCRSIQNFCGVGETYCNEKSVWTSSCGVPTDPPVTGVPTTIWPSLSPSLSVAPAGINSPIPTENFSALLDTTFSPSTSSGMLEGSMIPSTMNNVDDTSIPTPTTSVTTSTSPTYANVDDQTFAPDDPAGSFFCGSDWTQAITECPHRCPTGETTQCPDGMQCYAFTPCIAVGMNTPPSIKPTWEPTKHPIIFSDSPTTTLQYWGAQNDAKNEEGSTSANTSSAPISTKPTNAPSQDQCRGFPCDYVGECRSSLGFCGTGVGYCNSVSSWIPDCGGGKGIVRQPTTSPNIDNIIGSTSAPAIAWEEWSKGESDANATTVPSLSNNTYDPAVWENWGGTGKSAQAKEDESYAWWTNSNSSTMRQGNICCLIVSVILVTSWTMSSVILA